MSAMSDKEKVLAVYPDAESRYDYASGELQVVVSGLFYKSWADAASRLPAAAAPDESQKPVPAKLPEAAPEELCERLQKALTRFRYESSTGRGQRGLMQHHIDALTSYLVGKLVWKRDAR